MTRYVTNAEIGRTVTRDELEHMLKISDWAERLGKGMLPMRYVNGDGYEFLVFSLGGTHARTCDAAGGRTLPEAAEAVVKLLVGEARRAQLPEPR